jgi:hypothetical protein
MSTLNFKPTLICACVMFCLGVSPDEGNLLRDSELVAVNTVGGAWFTEAHAGASISAVVDQPGQITLDISKAGTAGWHGQFLQNGIPVVEGRGYVLVFTASGSLTGPIEIVAMQNGEPWAWLGEMRSYTLTEKPRTFVYRFVSSQTSDNARVTFQFGTQSGRLTLGDIKLIAE